MFIFLANMLTTDTSDLPQVNSHDDCQEWESVAWQRSHTTCWRGSHGSGDCSRDMIYDEVNGTLWCYDGIVYLGYVLSWRSGIRHVLRPPPLECPGYCMDLPTWSSGSLRYFNHSVVW
jgi:hypothetical protein